MILIQYNLYIHNTNIVQVNNLDTFSINLPVLRVDKCKRRLLGNYDILS